MLNWQSFYRLFRHNSKGFSIVEVLVALALLGIIAVAFLGALSTASKAMIIADERATAESLARSQMEYVKNQEYSDVQWSYKVTDSSRTVLTSAPSWWDPVNDNPPLLSSNYAGYSVEISAEDFDADDDGDIDEDDDGIQKITVAVSHHGEPVLTLEGYKVDR